MRGWRLRTGINKAQSRGPKPGLCMAVLGLTATGALVAYTHLTDKKTVRTAMNEHGQLPREKKPAYTQTQAQVVFVLGGPGAGKGTQCANLVRDYGFVHLSAGDLLREEQAQQNSRYGELIATYIKEGRIVPQEVTLALIKAAMDRALQTRPSTTFLIDGFPRKMDQALRFEEDIVQSRFVLFFDCSEQTMLHRLLKRGESSGRADDNAESIKKRFHTFTTTSLPVVEYFDMSGKVVRVSCEQSPSEVYETVKRVVSERLTL